MPTKEKQKQVDVLKDKISKASSIIITDHTGINVNDLTGLRRDLKNSDAEFRVSKNTLLKIAAEESGFEGLTDTFVGPTSMVFGFNEPSDPARIIYKFSKDSNRPAVKSFILENQILTVDDYKKIAQLPPKDQVLAILISSIEGPITNFVSTCDGIIRNFIGTIDALAETKK